MAPVLRPLHLRQRVTIAVIFGLERGELLHRDTAMLEVARVEDAAQRHDRIMNAEGSNPRHHEKHDPERGKPGQRLPATHLVDLGSDPAGFLCRRRGDTETGKRIAERTTDNAIAGRGNAIGQRHQCQQHTDAKQHGQRQHEDDADENGLAESAELFIENMRGDGRKEHLHRLEGDRRTERPGQFEEFVGKRPRPEFADDHVVDNQRAGGDQTDQDEGEEMEGSKTRLALADDIVT